MVFKTLSCLYANAADLVIAACVAPFKAGLSEDSPTLSDVMHTYVSHMNQLHVSPHLDHFKRLLDGVFRGLSLSERLTLLRQEVTGRDIVDSHEDPFKGFGPKLTMYADYTASGKSLAFMQVFLNFVSTYHANPHSGKAVCHARVATEAYHDGLHAVLHAYGVDGDTHMCLMPTAGSSGALKFLQDLMGITIAITTQTVMDDYEQLTGKSYKDHMRSEGNLPKVFTTSWEHHSNGPSWDVGLCDREQIGLTSEGLFNLDDFKSKVRRALDDQSSSAPVILSFSVASNVSGVMLPRDEVEALVSQFRKDYPQRKLVLIYDAAGGGPYIPILLNSGVVDAIVESPHKMIGGDGTAGTVVLTHALYDFFTNGETPVSQGKTEVSGRHRRQTFEVSQRAARKSVSGVGGGVVHFVAPTKLSKDFVTSHVLVTDRNERETKGTPGCSVTQKTGLAFLTRMALGMQDVFNHEMQDVHEMLAFFQQERFRDKIWVIQKPFGASEDTSLLENRIPIFSFNVKVPSDHVPQGHPGNMIYHPGLISSVLNDLFGIQSRSGCSCAGEYGHELFSVTERQSASYRFWASPVDVPSGNETLPPLGFVKPGWERVNTHFTHSEQEKAYLRNAIAFVADHIHLFLPLYDLNPESGEWTLNPQADIPVKSGMPRQQQGEAFEAYQARVFKTQMDDALRLAKGLESRPLVPLVVLDEIADIQAFALSKENLSEAAMEMIQSKKLLKAMVFAQHTDLQKAEPVKGRASELSANQGKQKTRACVIS